MIKEGLKKIKKDHRQLSFHRTFGAVTIFPDEFDVDAGLGCPDQNQDGYPYGCTGYTQSELCQDEDGVKYEPGYTYKKTLLIENKVGQQVGCDIRDSLKSVQVYGVKKPEETDDSQASKRIRGKYYDALDGSGMDAFDSIRSAILVNKEEKRAVSVGTPWFPSFLNPDQNGVIQTPRSYDYELEGASWHNYKISGWKKINGVPYLKIKAWIGTIIGDKGFLYFPREVVNSLFRIGGTGAFTISKFTPASAQTVQLSAFTVILSYIRMILSNLVKKK